MRRINSSQDWHQLLADWQASGIHAIEQMTALGEMRRNVYREIEAMRKRPLFIYANKLYDIPAAPANVEIPNFIDFGDVEGFTDLINQVDDKERSVDIILLSPGGRPDVTERLVELLRSRFEEVHFLIPHTAFSAATMLALSGDSITLHPSGVLGPIDPQINGVPARVIKRGFERIVEIVKTEGPDVLPAYVPFLERYSIEILEICEDSEELSKKLASTWISQYMFKGTAPANLAEVVEFVSDYEEHKIHSRPLTFSKLKNYNLHISVADKALAPLLWETHILLMGFFNTTAFVKLYENSSNISYGKLFFTNSGAEDPTDTHEPGSADGDPPTKD